MKFILVFYVLCFELIYSSISSQNPKYKIQNSEIKTQNQEPSDSLLYPAKDEMIYPFSNSYKSSWSGLKNGKQQNMNKSANIKWDINPVIIENYEDETQFIGINEEGDGKTSYIYITGNYANSNVDININGRHIAKNFNNKKLEWKKNEKNNKGYFNNNVIWLKKFKRVVIENINLRLWDPNLSIDGSYNTDPELTASTSIRTDDCREVIIRDCYFGGEALRHHIQIQNSDRVFIDRVEIAGLGVHNKRKKSKDITYSSEKINTVYLCGGGIKISKTDYAEISGFRLPASGFRIWNVIQNCYIHDNNIALSSKNNWDGITTSIPGNSLIFNCYFENWGITNDELTNEEVTNNNNKLKIGADCALDLGEPEVPIPDKDYVFRIEHNIFDNCKGVKNSYSYIYQNSNSSFQLPASSFRSDFVSHLFTGNIYYNTPLWDYHTGYRVYHVRETFVFDDSSNKKYVYKFEGSDSSPVSFHNNIVYINTATSSFKIFNVRNFKTDTGSLKNFIAFKAENNLYIFRNNPAKWVNFVNNKKENIKTFDKWMDYETFGNKEKKGSVLIMLKQNQKVFKSENKQANNSPFSILNSQLLLLPEFEKEYLNLKTLIKVPDKKGMHISK
jgi:hypothetical protein